VIPQGDPLDYLATLSIPPIHFAICAHLRTYVYLPAHLTTSPEPTAMSDIETERLESTLKGKVIIITGGSSGIGRCTAKILASYGCKVAISGRSLEKLANVEKELLQHASPEDIMVSKVDIASDVEVEDWVSAVVAKFGQLDGAVNAASIEAPRMVPIWEMDNDTWNKVISTNLGGVMNSLRAELKHMKDGGSIVNVSSILSTVGLENNATYSAAKHGVLGLTRSVAKECGPRKIRVNALAP
jgi:NAD(P)-dependent dehydrogenase (short-subunit alcohol dehydrogenase family)